MSTRDKSGTIDVHLNLNVRGIGKSATLAINERCRELQQLGREVFRLGLGQSPFPVPEPVVQELRTNAHQKDYLAVEGLWELREAVAEYHRQTQELTCTGEDVLIGPGSKELMFLLQLVYYGDLVIPTPSWVSYAPQARIVGRHVHWLDTRESAAWKLTPDQLEALCRDDPDRPRILIINYPANPTGVTFEVDELKALADIAGKYRVVLLSDEIYGELHHEGRHVSIAQFYPEGTIVSGGLSKWCGAGGWRLGTFTFPRGLHWLRDAMAMVASETYTATSAPIQFAGVRAFQGSIEIERYLAQSRRILAALGNKLTDGLRQAGVDVLSPQGAFYLFPDFGRWRDSLGRRGITTSLELCETLLEETGVAVLPGSVFGRPPQELTARLAYVDFDGARVLAAAEFLPHDRPLGDSFVQEHCPRLIHAVDRISQWLGEP